MKRNQSKKNFPMDFSLLHLTKLLPSQSFNTPMHNLFCKQDNEQKGEMRTTSNNVEIKVENLYISGTKAHLQKCTAILPIWLAIQMTGCMQTQISLYTSEDGSLHLKYRHFSTFISVLLGFFISPIWSLFYLCTVTLFKRVTTHFLNYYIVDVIYYIAFHHHHLVPIFPCLQNLRM